MEVGPAGPAAQRVTETGPPEEAPQPSEAPRRRAVTAVLALTVLVSLLAISSVVLALVLREEKADRSDLVDARERAASAAGLMLVNLDSLSARTVDVGIKQVLGGAAGNFKSQFTRAQADLKTIIVKQKVTQSAELRSVAVVRSDLDTATVLVAVDRTVKDAAHPEGAVRNERRKVSLERHGGRWLVVEIEPVEPG